ncbi:MAG: VWA domain-containing protein [Pseudomonadota bacterium]|nr:VWA domain-containing protein [Pseudomonadota bacterium]
MFADNLTHFARILRSAGIPVGPDRVIAALAAVEAVGLERRGDIHAALSAVMLDRHEQQAIFDAAFDAFWRDPKLLEQMLAQLLPTIRGRGQRESPKRPQRLADALAPPRTAAAPSRDADADADQAIDYEMTLTASAREQLRTADFESMTAAEFELAKRIAEELPLPFEPIRRRRHAASGRGRIDLRATLLAMARQPATLVPRFSQPRLELPSLVVLLDISGSMDRYARLMLHYVHGLTRRHLKVHTLTFGTRLTNITRSLRNRDPDLALALAAAQVQDWKGGTRIASCLDDFNRHWARRLLGANAAVLLVSDGLDTDAHGELSRAARQLRLFSRQIVWLNPLLRFDRFEPRAAGIRAILPNVDRFLPVHNLASLSDLASLLRTARPGAIPAATRPSAA